MRFSQFFEIEKTQFVLDFFDISLGIDNAVYLDPYATQRRGDEWSDACSDLLNSFFNEILEGIRRGEDARVKDLFVHLSEPNETFLGVSEFEPRGRGIGEKKAVQLIHAIRNSSAFKTGILSDISETEMFIDGIGPDAISDITTNVLRGPLAEYTKRQCEIYGVSLFPTANIGPIWNMNALEWESVVLSLPHFEEKPVLLVPKHCVRREISLSKDDFYNEVMRQVLHAEFSEAASSLVKTFKSGKRKGQPRITYKEIEEKHPRTKGEIQKFVEKHPDDFKKYKERKSSSSMSNIELGADVSSSEVADELIARLSGIDLGSKGAGDYHDCIFDCMNFVFLNNLSNPLKEEKIHEGRKRIDITYDNSGSSPFFRRVLQSNQTRGLKVVIECKNYTADPENPELDQLAGRFSLTRGKFGILTCRELINPDLFHQRCIDTYNDDRGVIITLTDPDVIKLIELRRDAEFELISEFLMKKFNYVIS